MEIYDIVSEEVENNEFMCTGGLHHVGNEN